MNNIYTYMYIYNTYINNIKSYVYAVENVFSP